MRDRRIIVTFALVVVIWLTVPVVVALLAPLLPPGWLDTVSFEAAGALFSGLAFAGLLWTIWDQQRQIAESRAEQAELRTIQQRQAQELERTAELHDKSTRLFERRLEVSRLDALERQFRLHFDIWRAHRDGLSVAGIDARGPALAAHAVGAIRQWDGKAQPDCPARLIRFEKGEILCSNTVYGPFLSLTGDLLGIIDAGEVDAATKWQLMRLVKASLGEDERLLLLALVFHRSGDADLGPPKRSADEAAAPSSKLARLMTGYLLLDGLSEQAREDRVLRWAWMRYSPSREQRAALR